MNVKSDFRPDTGATTKSSRSSSSQGGDKKNKVVDAKATIRPILDNAVKNSAINANLTGISEAVKKSLNNLSTELKYNHIGPQGGNFEKDVADFIEKIFEVNSSGERLENDIEVIKKAPLKEIEERKYVDTIKKNKRILNALITHAKAEKVLEELRLGSGENMVVLRALYQSDMTPKSTKAYIKNEIHTVLKENSNRSIVAKSYNESFVLASERADAHAEDNSYFDFVFEKIFESEPYIIQAIWVHNNPKME